jgi:hypothetical protein
MKMTDVSGAAVRLSDARKRITSPRLSPATPSVPIVRNERREIGP